jgi:hypothetical protein
MKIEDLVQLLTNRLREYQLSKDYARMSGDLERMNAAEKEVLALEDTLYQLKLLVDASQSASVKETTIAEVIVDGSVAALSEYDITPYATDPLHEEKVMNILSNMGLMTTAEQIDDYIKGKYSSSPVTGAMVVSAAEAYTVDTRLLMAIMEQDSRFGTVGLAVSTLNPGNVGNDDDGNTRTYDSWQEGVTAVAEWLNRHRVSEEGSDTEDSELPVEPEVVATTTLAVATTSPLFATTTQAFATTTPTFATTTTATTTPVFATTTPETVVTTATTTPVFATTTPESLPVTISTTTSTTTPVIATTTPAEISTEATAAPEFATTTPAFATTTSTTTTSTLIPTTATSTQETVTTSGN